MNALKAGVQSRSHLHAAHRSPAVTEPSGPDDQQDRRSHQEQPPFRHAASPRRSRLMRGERMIRAKLQEIGLLCPPGLGHGRRKVSGSRAHSTIR